MSDRIITQYQYMFSILLENFLNSFESIWANKLRSSLSMLWIIIWVSSVIVLTALGNGSSKAITDKIEEMWTNVLTLQAGRGFWSSRDRASSSSSHFLNTKLVKNLKESITWLNWVLPVISWNGQFIYQWKDLSAKVNWVDEYYLEARNIEIVYGSNILPEHVLALDKVVILWQTVVTELFDWENPVWEKVKMWNNVFEVIGVIWESTEFDTSVFIPVTTAWVRIMWQKYYSQVIIIVDDAAKVAVKEAEIDAYLQNFLEVEDPNTLPYNISNQSEMLQNFSSITGTLTMLLAWIAGISLLVWWIWVMNIMLVSVTERTKEIWIRKAIWAWRFDILIQFLTEALTLSIIGGLIWIGLSYWAVVVLNYFSITAVISNDSVILSFCFSLAIGIIFWILPAYKAAKLRPIDALRFE